MRNGRIRVLVTEDSPFMRRTIRQLLAGDDQIEVVGEAADGVEALRAVESLRPDVVTMDINMPHVDGLAAVERIMANYPTPIVMLSSYTPRGSDAALRALALGAIDCVAKPSGSVDLGMEQVREELLRKVKVAARVRVVRTARTEDGIRDTIRERRVAVPRIPEATVATDGSSFLPCVVIAASTGGPAALFDLVPRLAVTLPAAMLVVQHMPAPYTMQLTAMLAARTALPVREARDGDRLRRGTVTIAPGACDTVVQRDGTMHLQPPLRGAEGCPSADVAMATAALAGGARVLGVVLTGMGRDGAMGVQMIRRAGGLVIAQDEASSLVHGMPRAALDTGCVRSVVPLEKLPFAIAQCVALLELAAAPKVSCAS